MFKLWSKLELDCLCNLQPRHLRHFSKKNSSRAATPRVERCAAWLIPRKWRKRTYCSQHLWELLKSVWSQAVSMQNRQGRWPFLLEQTKVRGVFDHQRRPVRAILIRDRKTLRRVGGWAVGGASARTTSAQKQERRYLCSHCQSAEQTAYGTN